MDLRVTPSSVRPTAAPAPTPLAARADPASGAKAAQVDAFAAKGAAAGAAKSAPLRTQTAISTYLSHDNLIDPMLPDILVDTGPLNYNDAMLEGIRQAKKLVCIEGYQLDREDIVELLLEKAKAGAQVVVLFDPVNDDKEGKKGELLDRLRAAKLPNLQVAEYKVIPGGDGPHDFEQILHVKKVIVDNPRGTLTEYGGGINFNEHSLFNVDNGWRVEGVAVLDSLDVLLTHYERSGGPVHLDPKLVPSAEVIAKKVRQRAKEEDRPLSTIELGACGRQQVLKAPEFDLKGLKARLHAGRELVVSSKDVDRKGVLDLVRQARQSGCPVTVVHEPMTERDAAKFEALLPKLAEHGVQVRSLDQVVMDPSYRDLVYRELDTAIAKKESIDVAAFVLSDDGVLDRLVAAHEAGSKVRAVVDNLDINGNRPNIKGIVRLQRAGIEVRSFDDAARKRFAKLRNADGDGLKLHCKLMLLGGQRVLGGSCNFSANGLTNNVEDGRLIHNEALTKTYADHLYKPLWRCASKVKQPDLVDPADRPSLVRSAEMSTPVEEAVFIVFDTETTGWVPSYDDRILSLSAQAVKLKANGKVEFLETFDSLLNPETNMFGEPYQVPERALRWSGLTAEQLAGAPLADEVLPRFVDFVQRQAKSGPVVLAGENVATDVRFVDYALSKRELAVKDEDGKRVNYALDAPFVDAMDLGRAAFPRSKKLRFHQLRDNLGIKRTWESSRHVSEVKATARVLAELVRRGQQKTVGELMRTDVLQFPEPTELLDTPSADSPAPFQVTQTQSGEPRLLPKDPTTGAYARRGHRVDSIEVMGVRDHLLRCRFVYQADGKQQERVGYLDPSRVSFRAPGQAFYRLRENGVELEPPEILQDRV